jgi:hypothetical protein
MYVCMWGGVRVGCVPSSWGGKDYQVKGLAQVCVHPMWCMPFKDGKRPTCAIMWSPYVVHAISRWQTAYV